MYRWILWAKYDDDWKLIGSWGLELHDTVACVSAALIFAGHETNTVLGYW